jgi:putative transcriptional regulator
MTPGDWKRLDAKTDEEITAAAMADPDAQPITPGEIADYRPPALSKVVRHKLGMTRQRFSGAYGIPLDALRAWESHEAEPSPAESAYLRLIEREPERSKLVPAE